MPKISFRIRSEKSQAGIYLYLYPSKKSRIEFRISGFFWGKGSKRLVLVVYIKTMELELLKLFFPEELVAHFNITGSAIKRGEHRDYLEVEFTERNELRISL